MFHSLEGTLEGELSVLVGDEQHRVPISGRFSHAGIHHELMIEGFDGKLQARKMLCGMLTPRGQQHIIPVAATDFTLYGISTAVHPHAHSNEFRYFGAINGQYQFNLEYQLTPGSTVYVPSEKQLQLR